MRVITYFLVAGACFLFGWLACALFTKNRIDDAYREGFDEGLRVSKKGK